MQRDVFGAPDAWWLQVSRRWGPGRVESLASAGVVRPDGGRVIEARVVVYVD